MPGIPPTWCSSAKDLVSTALGPSRLWATFGHGIVNEVYWPSTGQPQIRDMGFIVHGPDGWHELKRVNDYRVRTPAPWVPLPRFIHRGDGYTVELEAVPDSMRDVLLVRYALKGDGCRLYVLLAPHLLPDIADNSAVAATDGLRATGDHSGLVLCSDAGFERASAGLVGVSDGWQDFHAHGEMTWCHERADHGNVALMGELSHQRGVLALGFGGKPSGAETLARSSLAEGFDGVREQTVRGWQEWGERLRLPTAPRKIAHEAALSAAMLKVHEDRAFPGAVVASLSVPWGNDRDDTGGYHLVWARDAVEAGYGLLAGSQEEDARRMLAYLIATQHPDGHWAQNFYPDGTAFWKGIQLDEVGMPILLALTLAERDCLGALEGVTPTIRRSASYIARNGPITPQDRWEESRGLNAYTLAVEIAALVCAARFLRGDDRRYALSLADYWNSRIEDWMYVTGGSLAGGTDVPGYYVHVAPPPHEGGVRGQVVHPNHGGQTVAADSVISLDFLRLARLGLRRPDDPHVVHTLALADDLLLTTTPNGPGYHRYLGDGYGEHADGTPFDGTGIGRLWPLLTGERGHHALLLGEDPVDYLETLTAMTGPGGLIPEQVWDADPIPERGLQPGEPTGSAMPLVWAHAEFLKLLVARGEGHPLERTDAVWSRWSGQCPQAATWHWRDCIPFDALPARNALLVEATSPFTLHVGTDGWRDVLDQNSRPVGLDVHAVRLDAASLHGHQTVEFKRRFADDAGGWEDREWQVRLGRH